MRERSPISTKLLHLVSSNNSVRPEQDGIVRTKFTAFSALAQKSAMLVTDMQQELADKVSEYFAFDSRMAAVGVRGAKSTSHRTVYVAGEVTLYLEERVEEDGMVLSGQVVANGEPRRALITMRHLDEGDNSKILDALTNQVGYFTLPGLAGGNYTVRVVGQQVSLEFPLSLQAVANVTAKTGKVSLEA